MEERVWDEYGNDGVGDNDSEAAFSEWTWNVRKAAPWQETASIKALSTSGRMNVAGRARSSASTSRVSPVPASHLSDDNESK